jgi:hypothetical protein
MVAFLFFSQPLQLISGIPKDTIQNSASVVFAIGIPHVGQMNHLLRQLQGFFYVQIAGFQRFSPGFER